MTNTSFWRLYFVSRKFELWLQIPTGLRMNGPFPHHQLPRSCSWGGFLPDIYRSLHLLFSFPLHHPIHLEKGLLSESACWSQRAALRLLLTVCWKLWQGFNGGSSASPVAKASLTEQTRLKNLILIDGEWTGPFICWLKWRYFCFMDDICNVLMYCLYNVKTNLHNSTASEDGLFLSLSQNLKLWTDQTLLMRGTAHKE